MQERGKEGGGYGEGVQIERPEIVSTPQGWKGSVTVCDCYTGSGSHPMTLSSAVAGGPWVYTHQGVGMMPALVLLLDVPHPDAQLAYCCSCIEQGSAALLVFDCSIVNTLYTYQEGFYRSKMLTSCKGLSGAGVIQSDTMLVAINIGVNNDDVGDCDDVVQAPNLTVDFDPKTCEKESGGASLECFSGKLPA